LPVRTDSWMNGAWNNKKPQFHLLAEMLGFTQPSLSPDDLQGLFRSVASAKVFAENVAQFLEVTGRSRKSAAEYLEGIERKLGLMEPLPFMSVKGTADADEFDGVAIWPTGITNWTKLRLEQILTSYEAGARFRHVVCLHSSRVCSAPGDRRHPLIKDIPEGQEPSEFALQRQLAQSVKSDLEFRFAMLPRVNDADRPLSLEQQLVFLKETGQYDELIGGADIYVPSTPNSLYVPLHVRRVLGHDNVWFSQAGARLVRATPAKWWPSLQDVMTTPNGIIRLWVELLHAGCMTP
jgi:hypothetical protein